VKRSIRPSSLLKRTESHSLFDLEIAEEQLVASSAAVNECANEFPKHNNHHVVVDRSF